MVANVIKWTTRDLEVMPDDGGRYEIIDGDLHVTRSPHIRHQGVATRISTRLEVWSEATGLGRSFQTPGLVFTPTDAVIPDVVWASNRCLAIGIDDKGHFTLAPELVVEVLSKDAKLFPHHKACKSIQLKGLGMKIILHRYLSAENQQPDREFKLKLDVQVFQNRSLKPLFLGNRSISGKR
jgi:Putative restriction endonuclease